MNPVDQLIKGLEAQRRDLDRKLKIAYQLRDIENPPAPTTSRPSAKGNGKVVTKSHRGAGFVATILPHLQSEGVKTADELFTFLRKQPGMRQVSKDSFLATLSTELKRKQPRLARVAPGQYAAIRAAAPTITDDEPVLQAQD